MHLLQDVGAMGAGAQGPSGTSGASKAPSAASSYRDAFDGPARLDTMHLRPGGAAAI